MGWFRGVVGCCAAALVILTMAGPADAVAVRRSVTVEPPTDLTAKAGVASVTLRWHSARLRGVTFTVTSDPSGKQCVVVARTECTIVVTDSIPWRFEVLASLGSSNSAESVLSASVPHRTLVVLAGQSNAMGAQSFAVDPTTGTDYLIAPYVNGADATSTVSWMPWGVDPAPVHTRSGQVPLDSPQLLTGSGLQIFGPEIGWARAIYADTGESVSIVKAAYPNTSLQGDWLPSIADGNFSQMVTKILSTMAADAHHGQLDTIGAIAWYQGEADATDPKMAADYQTNLTTFIQALRSDLPAEETTPIVLVKESLASLLGTWQSAGSCGTTVDCAAIAVGDGEVRAADDWAAANLAHVVDVDTLGLARFEGLIHLTDDSELVVGQEIAAASDHSMP